MEMPLIWNENKRQINLLRHGLDFAHAGVVLESRYRLDIEVIRQGEIRIQSFLYVMERLAVLTVVHLERDAAIRIISFRTASEIEMEAYCEWLSQENE